MTEIAVVAVPIKPFDTAKARLATSIPSPIRERLSREMASRTIEVIDAAGAHPVVVAAGPSVLDWAISQGVETINDQGSGLDGAALAAVRLAMGRGASWLICHADLPFLTVADLDAALDVVRTDRPVIAPSSDGGTSLLGWNQVIRFGYGPSSFHRHLTRLARHDPVVLARTGLLLDIDEPGDLDSARTHRRGLWIDRIMSSVTSPG